MADWNAHQYYGALQEASKKWAAPAKLKIRGWCEHLTESGNFLVRVAKSVWACSVARRPFLFNSTSPIFQSSNNMGLFEPEEVSVSSSQWPTSPSPAIVPATLPAPPIIIEDSTQLTFPIAFHQSAVESAVESAAQSASQSASQSVSQSRSRVAWNPAMDEAMLLGLFDAKKDGWETDNGNFKIHGWNIAVKAVRRVTHQTINKNNLENRWRSNKCIWRLWMRHKNQISGWTWCAERETYINDPEVMEEYFQRHMDLIIFRDQGPPFRELNEQLLEGKLATGQYAVGSRAMRRQLDTDDDLYPSSSPASNALALNDLALTAVDSSAADSPAPERKRLRKGKKKMNAESISELRSVLLEMNKEMVNGLREVSERAPEKATRLFLQEVNELLLEEWRDSNGMVPYWRYAAVPRLFASNGAMAQVYLGFSDSSLEQRRAFIMDILENAG
ncbi:hypothetical protein I7I51_02839 [Histoplasma capsulatum]|uniref:Myb/SANT-like domain-containing protein n=1 Tax=Ajellomyces capsulatus TaxID=5037 RepID=A0A8A1MLE3_AJECA|nr:hypothetical protein I7I51_02839 [Histoplasma capsulatum]